MMDFDKKICYTLDLERDYAGVAPVETYETFSRHARLEQFSDLVRRHDLRLTVFVTGKVLEQHWETLAYFQQVGAEIELHGYDHVLDKAFAGREVQKGVAVYRSVFGRVPLGYRAPGGVTSPMLMEELVRAGIRYDSSVFPSVRWGMYNNLGSPLGPHLHPRLPLLELPIGVIPWVRIPIAVSYIRILGFPLHKMLLSLFGRPSPIVYLLHLVDLISVEARKRLPPVLRCVDMRGDGRGFEVFKASVRYFESAGYRSDYMSNLYSEYAAKLLT
jgi:peptidoglycan/xylan/chitin deacetylase (PgdA/CDA1 family)